MKKDLEYYRTMFTNKSALLHENIEDIQEAGNWLINKIDKYEGLALDHHYQTIIDEMD